MPRGEPLFNPLVQSDIDMQGFKLTNTPAGTGNFDNVTITDVYNFTTKEIWLSATRADGKGMGTEVDPYDCSTSVKLDTVLRGISTGTTVHFGPGTFQTSAYQQGSSSLGFSVKLGCKYIGSGKNVTTVKCITAIGGNGSSHQAQVFSSGGLADVSGAEVRDMTVDANGAVLVAANSSDFKTYGVALTGSNCVISGVHLIGMYGHLATGAESFGLGISPATVAGVQVAVTNALIENCLVDTFASGFDYGQMICMSGQAASIQGTMIDNIVLGMTNGTSAYQAYSGGASEDTGGVTMENCVSTGANRFLYMDTGHVRHLRVHNCHASGLNGYFLDIEGSNGYIYDDITISDCTADFGTSTTDTSFVKITGADTPATNIQIFGNTATGMASGHYYQPIQPGYVDGLYEWGNNWRGNFRTATQTWGTATHLHFNNKENASSALTGSVKVTGNFSSGGSLYYAYTPPGGDYVLATGDVLKYEILLDDANNSTRPSSYILFSDSTGNSPARDQNGICQLDDTGNDRADIGWWARGRWYSREFPLETWVGKTSQYFFFGWRGTDTAQTGVNTFYIRNIRVLDKNGKLKQLFYNEGSGDPALQTHSGVSGYSGSVISNALGYTAENVANKGVANGYASLDGTAKVPAAQLPTLASGTIASTLLPLRGDNAGNAVAATVTGTGSSVLATSPTLVTPTIGVATATSVNKWTFTAPSTTATVTAGADNLTYSMPEITTLIGFRHIPQNSKSANYTTVLNDSGKEIYHPVGDNNARTFTIDSNANVAYPIGTVILFTNMSPANLSVAITADTMTLLGSGLTGTRTVAQYGSMAARKDTSTSWIATPIANVT